MAEKVSRDRGYRSYTIAISRDMGPLSPVDFQEAKRPLRTKAGKRPIKVGKRPIKEGKRPIKAMLLVGMSVGCLMGCFRAPPAMAENGPPSKKDH